MPEMNALTGFLVDDVIRMLGPSLVVDCPLHRFDSILCLRLCWRGTPFRDDLQAVDSATTEAGSDRGTSPSPRIDKIRFEPSGRS